MTRVLVSIGILLIMVLPKNILGQHFFRVKADFSAKEKYYDGRSSLTIGTVYYDRTARKIVHKNTFPEKHTWLIKDSALYKIEEGQVINTVTLPFKPEFTIYHMSLQGNLKNFGLEDSFYEIKEVEKEDGMVITTWTPIEKVESYFGDVIISQKDKKLFGIAFFNSHDELMRKQFFKEYENIHGFEFPAKIVEITYTDNGENYKVTEYKNIVVDEMQNDNIYNYTVPQP